MKAIHIILHLIVVAIFTIFSQIGGLVWLISLGIRRFLPKKRRRIYQWLSFLLMYLLFTFFIIPPIASQFGRTKLPISKSSNLRPHTFGTVILNRHYVKPALKEELQIISKQFNESNPTLQTVYLDANFPFWDGFPLLPHLSHNDGRKIDLAFHYTKDGQLTNKKPSNSGYGVYAKPLKNEYNQPNQCLEKGYWQYDYPQYLTLGSDESLTFEMSKTKELIELILNRKKTQKVFLEPHLKTRMKIDHPKLRFHGCKSVRHDDHIHYQIK